MTKKIISFQELLILSKYHKFWPNYIWFSIFFVIFCSKRQKEAIFSWMKQLWWITWCWNTYLYLIGEIIKQFVSLSFRLFLSIHCFIVATLLLNQFLMLWNNARKKQKNFGEILESYKLLMKCILADLNDS